MSIGLMLLLFPQRLQLNIPIQTHSETNDNSDSAKTRFCKSIPAMSIKHTPKKRFYLQSICHSNKFLSHRTFRKLQFLLQMLLNRQIQSLNFNKQMKHHPPSGTYVIKPEPDITIQPSAWTTTLSFIWRAVTMPISILPHCASRSHALSLNLSGFHHDFTLRA